MEAITALEYYAYFSNPATYFEEYIDNSFDSMPEILANEILKKTPNRNRLAESTFVDIGSGPGTSLQSFYERFKFTNCIAIDGSYNMLAFIDSVISPSKIQLQTQCKNLCCDTFDIADATVDIAAACRVVSYLSTLEVLFAEVGRIIKPGGYWGYDVVSYNSDTSVFIGYEGSMQVYAYSTNYLHDLEHRNGFSSIFVEDERDWQKRVKGVSTIKQIRLLQKI